MSTVTFQGEAGSDIEVKIGGMEYTPVQVVCEGIYYNEEGITVRVAPVFFPSTQGLAIWADQDKHALYVGPNGELLFVKTPDMNPSTLVTEMYGLTITLRRLDVEALIEYNKSATLA